MLIGNFEPAIGQCVKFAAGDHQDFTSHYDAKPLSHHQGNVGGDNDSRYRTIAHSLFGNVSLQFRSDGSEGGEMASGWLGSCRFTRLRADAHLARSRGSTKGGDIFDMVKILVQLHGTSKIRQGEKTMTIDPDSIVIYDAAHPYEIENPSAVDVLMFHMPKTQLGSLAGPVRIELAEDGLQRVLRTMMETTAVEIGRLDSGARQSLGLALAELGRALYRERTADRMVSGITNSLGSLYAGMADFVTENLGKQTLDARRIAQKMGCSIRYVYRAFETQGVTPAAYIWDRRLQAAAAALALRQPRPGFITEIAYDCGFSSSAHFARLFRDRYGCSPSKWRNSGQSVARYSATHSIECVNEAVTL